MKRYPDRKFRHYNASDFYIFTNPASAEYNPKKIDYLAAELKKFGKPYQIIEMTSPDSIIRLKGAIQRHPIAIIACGGDSTVNLVAQNLIRRTTILGIYPLGKFNNIYRSLYGDPDTKKAVRHILSGDTIKIDHGLAGGRFFTGSIGIGLMVELAEQMAIKRIPRFGIGWSRIASQAAASVPAKQLSIKIDAFRFDMTPRLLNINLLPYTTGLPIAPACINDDGKGEVIFDIGQDKAILSSFIRMIYKKKYIYSDEIRMFRGRKISIAPLAKCKIYLDGEIFEHPSESLDIEFFEKKIRVFAKSKD
jgi:diacylglycerol kinase family enzyme